MFASRILRKRLQPLVLRPKYQSPHNLRWSSTCVLPDKAKTIEKFDFKHYTHTIQDINKSIDHFIDHEITLNGWLDGAPRKISKNLVFVHFRDFNGDLVQVVCKDDTISQALRSMKPEDSISITGKVGVKKAKSTDAEKSWELVTSHLEVLNNANVKVTQLDSLKSNPSAYPPEYRYLQLRLPYYQNALKMRAKAAKIARSVLDSKYFTEIETPLLFKSTPEGAKEFLVPTRKKGFFYALPQSPQQYKQLLMASGFKGYYQIAKCFRDEDLRADRQPEFTQIDLEMSFGKAEDVQHVVEELVTNIWSGVRNLPLYRIEGDSELVELKPDHL
ncbi:unnamed protein product [Ambrosiozyma monospora]|uniref:Unnamed protein product n=1 Tax=Ambrosiozyma monospora TaxID=43982 RepID=A0A9W6YZP5_AMBMO|nr:unnamed protein product [Ambrosiozyma monospora]